MKKAFTITGVGRCAFLTGLLACGHAFTMAEILLSLTIIGVVAAITLPSLTGNINERTWNTQRKALYARMSQAVALMPALNGYGTLTEDEDGNVIADTVAETFVTNGLSKVLKINNICDSEHLGDCGINLGITTSDGSSIAFPLSIGDLFSNKDSLPSGLLNTKAAAFETANGESIVVYYNPRCLGNWKKEGRIHGHVGNDICANFAFDLNGIKGPNTVSKDIGIISVFYSSDSSVVMPLPFVRSPKGQNFSESKKVCRGLDDNLRQANLDEIASIYINQVFMGNTLYNGYVGGVWGSDSLVDKTKNPYHINNTSGLRYNSYPATSPYGTFCVKR